MDAQRVARRTSAAGLVGAAAGALAGVARGGRPALLAASTALNATLVGGTFFGLLEAADAAGGGHRLTGTALAGAGAGALWGAVHSGGSARRSIVAAASYGGVALVADAALGLVTRAAGGGAGGGDGGTAEAAESWELPRWVPVRALSADEAAERLAAAAAATAAADERALLLDEVERELQEQAAAGSERY